MYALITEAGPTRMTVITYLNPVVAVTLGVVVLAEPITTGMLIGFPLIALGSIFATARSGAGRAADASPALPTARALE
jgi:drug/metabolite transporter (DMT)-like permease